MKVRVKELAVTMELGSNGITFDVYDTKGKFLGDLRIGKATIEWCKGKIHPGNGVQIKWEHLIDWFESHQSK